MEEIDVFLSAETVPASLFEVFGCCKNNPGVNCKDRSNCDKCGWNPEVAKARIPKIIEHLNAIAELENEQ